MFLVFWLLSLLMELPLLPLPMTPGPSLGFALSMPAAAVQLKRGMPYLLCWPCAAATR